jgi:lysophospholipase L1-like esterase
MDAAGDSITKGFNAQDAFPCPNSAQEAFNWATSETPRGDLCSDGGDGVFSQAERLECRKGSAVVRAAPNSAAVGAQMLTDFVPQARRLQATLSPQPPPRYAPVWLGHNDVCGGTLDKLKASCAAGADQDPNNYCRTTPAAFEREFRKGLDLLLTVPELKIGVASLLRVSELCTHGQKRACQFPGGAQSCEDLWEAAAQGGGIVGLDQEICGSLTVDCSEERVTDAYVMAKAYHDILARVTAEYARIAQGGPSAVVTVGGEMVGGARKAAGVTLAFSEAPWVYSAKSDDLSCCDCFHPSPQGQDTAARILFDGFTCSASDACCAEAGEVLADGWCAVADTGGTFVPGLF